MKATTSTTEEQRRRAAIEHGVAQVRLEGMEPSPLFFELAERYIRGEMTLADILVALKQVAAAHS